METKKILSFVYILKIIIEKRNKDIDLLYTLILDCKLKSYF